VPFQASAEGGPDKVKGTILLNCAGGMNTKVSLLMASLKEVGLLKGYSLDAGQYRVIFYHLTEGLKHLIPATFRAARGVVVISGHAPC